jgi:hypothetical protein
MLDGERGELNAFETANIDRGHAIAGRIGSLAKRVYAAVRAKTMPDGVRIEGVGGEILFRRKQAKLVSGHKPEKGPLSGADRAVAIHDLRKLAIDPESNLTTVTTALVNHCMPPLLCWLAPGFNRALSPVSPAAEALSRAQAAARNQKRIIPVAAMSTSRGLSLQCLYPLDRTTR